MAFRIINANARSSLWVTILFYFALSLLIAAVFCYIIFIFKNYLQQGSLKELDTALESVGTDQQKDYEKTVSSYQKKINDFVALLKNREFVSAVFSFMEKQTFFDVWFDKFTMNKKDAKVDLSGQADNMAAFSRQVTTLEKNEYIKKITVLNSKLGSSGAVEFTLSIVMDSKIFKPAGSSLEGFVTETAAPSGQIFNTGP